MQEIINSYDQIAWTLDYFFAFQGRDIFYCEFFEKNDPGIEDLVSKTI